MNYHIVCTCGGRIDVIAENDESAVKKLIPAMDVHISQKNHPDVPPNLTLQQKEGMVRAAMKKE